MSDTTTNARRHRKAYRKRRRYRERLNTEPFRRRIATRIEHAGKRLFVGILGHLIAPRKTNAPLLPDSLHNILIIRNDAIGDMVLTTPFWRILKQNNPNLRIGVIGSFRNLPVIATDPDVDYRFECNGATIRAVWKSAAKTRKHKWDLVLPMIYNKKTKMALLSKIFAPHALASMVLLADDPVEQYEKLFSICIRTKVRMRPEDGPMLDLMRLHLGGTLRTNIEDDEWRPTLRMDEAALHAAKAAIDSLLEFDGTSSYFHINLDAKMEFKEFGLENTLQLSRCLLQEYRDHSVVWTSSPIVTSKIQVFLDSQYTERIHYVTTNSIDALAGVVRGSSVVISPDTSVIHIASAEQRPVVGLYHFQHEWPPYKVPNRVLTPVYGQPVATIPVERVLDAVRELLFTP